MKILLDTNILVHAYNSMSPHREKASEIIERAARGEIKACLAAQVLYEFFAVITNPKRIENPMRPHEAADLCMNFWESTDIEKLNSTLRTPQTVFNVLKEQNLSRAKFSTAYSR